MIFDRRTGGRPVSALVVAFIALVTFGVVRAEDLSGPPLVKALEQGGYVIVMRHASSPQAPPGPDQADPGNPTHERQLDATGRETATAMGAAIKTLHISIAQVWSSPTYRALQTIQLAGLPQPRTAAELGDGGRSMQASGASQSAWLKAKVAEPPRPRTDTLIVTHLPNIAAAFGQAANGLADGEAVVFHPTGDGRAEVIGRIKIEAWPAMAK